MADQSGSTSANRSSTWPWLALLIGSAASVTAAAGAIGGHPNSSVTVSLLHDGAGMIYLIVGVLAWNRRPHNRTGMLMTLAGLAWFLVDFKEAASPVPFTIGDLLGNVVYGVIAQLGLAFPSGHLQSARERFLVGVTYVWVVIGAALPAVFAQSGPACDCGRDLLNVRPDSGLYNVANTGQEIGDIVLAAFIVGVVVLHRARATPPARRAMAPVVWASGPIVFVVIALNVSSSMLPGWLSHGLPALVPLALATLPLSFVVGMVRSRLASLAIGHLVVELTTHAPSDGFRDVIAKTLGDNTLELAYFVSPDGWVDRNGRPLSLPDADPKRAYTLLERSAQPIAALIHDRSLRDDPTLVSEVAAASALAIENERLKVELIAQLTEVQESRTRLVEVADIERRKLERDLHDGAQQRLVSLALTLGRAREGLHNGNPQLATTAVDTAATDLQSALEELRELASGIRPAILTDAGLGLALESLIERAPVPVTLHHHLDRRCSDTVEAAAYFSVSEAITNAAKHAQATKVTVDANVVGDCLTIVVADDGVGGATTTGGTGLRGLVDRLAALGGSLSVTSAPGNGTELRITIPCE